jgi:hypothetical protein
MPPRNRRVETFEEEPEGPMQILQAAHYTLPHYPLWGHRGFSPRGQVE